MSSRSGLVETIAAGQPINSSIRRIYLIACAGRSAHERAPAVEPVYEVMDGWPESTHGARSWAQLPAQAIKYIRRIEELIRCPVALVSTSPEREDTILVRDPFAD